MDHESIKKCTAYSYQEQLTSMKWALKRHCLPRDYVLFILGCEKTGLRVGDMLKLKSETIRKLKKEREKVLGVKEGKTQKIRDIYIGNCFDEIYEYAVRLKVRGCFLQGKDLGPLRRLNNVAEFAGVEHVGNQRLRKTFGHWFYKATKDVAMLQGILNHSQPSVTLRYIGITQEETTQLLKHFSVFNN